jgi:recombination protein RecR
VWNGKYFLIGKNLKLTEKNPEEKIFLQSLISKINNDKLKEITFALSLNPEGENTKEYIKNIIFKDCLEKKIKITELGRGLSLGSEIEYSDSITLHDAFNNRK